MGNKSSKREKQQNAQAPAPAPAPAPITAPTTAPAAAPPSKPTALPLPGAAECGGAAESKVVARSVRRDSLAKEPPSVLNDSVPDPHSVTGTVVPDIKAYYDFDEEKDKLGKGHFGMVYRARNKQHGYSCALKCVIKTGVRGMRLADLKNEINIMKEVSHPNIVTLHEVIETTQHVYFAIEFCTGGELFFAITNAPEGHFTEKIAASIAKDLLSAVDHCHQNNICHRDLKPENILLASKELPADADRYISMKVVDFGLSRCYEDDEVMRKRVGTPYYIAPEVLDRRYDSSCDMWSLGVIFYILLCGYPPFRGDTDRQIYHDIRHGRLVFEDDPGENCWQIMSPEAIDLISKLVVRDPAARLTAAQALQHPWIEKQGPSDPVPLPNTVMRRLSRFVNENAFKRLAKVVIASSLPADQVESLEPLFKQYDADNSGTISFAELKAGLQAQLEASGNEAMLASVDDALTYLQSIDVDGDGEVNFSEFVAATMQEHSYNTRQRMLGAYHHFDQDGDGSLSIEEVRQALGDDAIATDIIARFDADNDGFISFEEFKSLMKDSGTEAANAAEAAEAGAAN